MAKSLTSRLQEAEDSWKETSPQWKARLDQFHKWERSKKARDLQQDRQKKQKKDSDAPREDSSAFAWEATFNEDDPQPNFSFAGKPSSKEELDDLLTELASKWVNTPIWAVDALRRGIAVHHAGMGKAYRVAIEK